MEWNRKLKNKPMIIWSINLIKQERICNRKKVSSTNGVGKTGELHAKE